MAKLKLQLTVDDKGTVVMKDFGKKTEQSMKTATSSTSKYTSALKGLVSVYAALKLVQLAKDWANLYMVQESAENALAVAMKNAQTYTKANHDMLKMYAAALQTTTTYGDEVTISTMANLQAYGMTTKELKAATIATMDLATAKKIDLRAASELIGKAFVGETGTLSRYGIILEKGTKKTEKFAEVLKLVAKQFGGAAQAELDTYAGKWDNLANAWSDAKEPLGELILIISTKLIPHLRTVATLVKAIAQPMETIKGINRFMTALLLPGALPGAGVVRRPIIKRGAAAAPTGAGGEALGEFQMQDQAFFEQRLGRIETLKKANEDYWEADWKANEESQAQKNANYEQDKQNEEDMARLRQAGAMTALSDWAYFFQWMGKENEGAFKIFKAISIAEATINTYIAATRALAELGPILGPIAAAAMIAKGFAMVSQIQAMSPGGGGGGGGGGAVGTYPASPTTGLPTTGGGGGRTVIINIEGDIYGDDAYIDALADKINVAVESRGVRLVSSEQR